MNMHEYMFNKWWSTNIWMMCTMQSYMTQVRLSTYGKK